MGVWIILGCYVLITLVIGVVNAKKANSMANFVVGGREAGPWMSAFAFGTTYFSAVLFIGYAGNSGWNFGWWAVLIGLGNAVLGTWLAWKVLANRTRAVTRQFKIKTMPQLFEKRYNSKPMKIYAAIVIFVFMTPYSASVYSGLAYLCDKVFHIEYIYCMIAIALIAAIYVVLGGYLAALKVDFVQGILMIVGIAAMIGFIVAQPQVGGIAHGLSTLTQKMDQAGILSLSGNQVLSLISLILLTSIGGWGLPQMVQKFYGIADKKAARAGTVISTGFSLIISCGAYFIGALTRLFFTDVPKTAAGKPNYDVLVPGVLEHLPELLLGLILVLVLAASISTLSSITLTSCSAVSMDLIEGGLCPKIQRKTTLLLTRIFCLLFIVFSFLIAAFKLPIIMLMSFSWGSVAGSFLAPYLLGLYWKKMNRAGAWTGMISGLVVSIALAIGSGFNAGNAPLFGVIAIIVSFVGCFTGSLIARAKGAKCASEENAFLQVQE